MNVQAAQEWLLMAEKDLKAAQILLHEPSLSNIALFHCQQCVEKSLKAILEFYSLRVPKIHNIQRLHALVLEKTNLNPIIKDQDIDFLDSIYIDSRYPTGMGLLPEGMPSKSDAENAIKISKHTLDVVKERLLDIEKRNNDRK